jgi:hypothetical protein
MAGDNRPAFGTWGNLNQRGGEGQPNLDGLPDSIKSQYRYTELGGGDAGPSGGYWNLNDNPWGGFKGEDGKYYVQVGDPSNWRTSGDGAIKDPKKVTYQDGAGWVTEASNLNDEGIGGFKHALPFLLAFAGGVAAMYAAPLLAGSAAAPSSTAAAIAGTDAAESAGTLALNAAGTGVAPYAGTVAATGSTAGALAGVDAAESGGTLGVNAAGTGVAPYAPTVPAGAVIPETVPPPTGGTIPPPEVPPPTPPPAGLPPGTQAPAPVVSSSPPVSSTGIINTARNAAQPALDWYNGLSPAARMVVNQGVSSGASALLQGIGQRNQLHAQEAADQRHRDDVIRRGQVQPFAPGAITPKPKSAFVPPIPGPGIIDTARGRP